MAAHREVRPMSTFKLVIFTALLAAFIACAVGAIFYFGLAWP